MKRSFQELRSTLLLLLLILRASNTTSLFCNHFRFSIPRYASKRQPHSSTLITMAEDETAPPQNLSPTEVAPLISLSSNLWNIPLKKTETRKSSSSEDASERQKIGREVVKALQTSGFLLIQSDLIPPELQRQALQDATQWLSSENNKQDPMVITHPTDPKTYVMLEDKHVRDKKIGNDVASFTPTLRRYWGACEKLKKCVLRAIGVGLRLEHPEDLASWHDTGMHSAMRLLHYPPTTPRTGNRCKAHSDYGTVTLLSTDGVSGLGIFLQGKWWPVPHVPGSVVVNIGSLLSEWTQRGKGSVEEHHPLLATVHRVAGPASENSGSDPNVLQQAMSQGRTSIAFFADPDDGSPLSSEHGMTMEAYIQWRSGGSDPDRSGVAFTPSEQDFLANPRQD